MNRSCRVGIHGRNAVDFSEADYRIISEAKIETIKMMSFTRADHFRRLKQVRPDLEIITRLHDDRFRPGRPSAPEQFAQRMVPIMRQLQPYCVKFEIHNEPNHLDGVEGWGDSDEDARSFNGWFLRTYSILKQHCPWAQLGFPGLAIPHRDLEWIELCRPAVEAADWLGVHCYWQTPPNEMHNHLSDFWGLRFKYYHQKFPGKVIDLTEVGSANVHSGIPFPEITYAREATEYLTECFKYPYLNSASFFILSSPNPDWQSLAWRTESGQPHKVTWAVRDMRRPHLEAARPVAQPAQPKPAAEAAPATGPVEVSPPLVQNLAGHLPQKPAAAWPQRALSQIDRIIIHHSGVPASVNAARIAAIMVNQQQRPGINYHYFIAAEGAIQQTSRLSDVTAHSNAQLSAVSLGVGFAGNFTKNAPPPAQIEAGGWLIAWLLQQFRLSPQVVFGHKELVDTQSPGLQWDSGAMWGRQLRQKIAAYLSGDAP